MKTSRKRIKEIIKSWQVGDYLRQLSIVVAGIVITFWGSEQITNMTHHKEVKNSMQLISEELQHNRKALKDIQEKLDKDIHMSKLLIENRLNLQSIPIDTLWKYKGLFSELYEFDYRTDALDVLKGSSLMQYIPDKRLLQELLQVYYQLEEQRQSITVYYNLKKDILFKLIFYTEPTLKEINYMNLSFSEQMTYMISQTAFTSFIQSVPSMSDWNAINRLEKELGQLIITLEEKYH